MSEEKPVKSPCISVCALNTDDICVGCYRTALEITDWVMYSNEQKREVLQQCHQRFKTINKDMLL